MEDNIKVMPEEVETNNTDNSDLIKTVVIGAAGVAAGTTLLTTKVIIPGAKKIGSGIAGGFKKAKSMLKKEKEEEDTETKEKEEPKKSDKETNDK